MSAGRDEVLRTLDATGIVAVLRAAEPRGLVDVVRALAKGGVRAVEVTMTVPGALQIIEQARRELPIEIHVGAGTVLDPTSARLAIIAGADFLVSPAFDPEVITVSRTYGIAMMPGALTPTEILQAWRAGADVVKVFPGRVGTPDYFADLRGPFPDIRLMPTGNVDATTAPQYIASGAVAVGIGKALVDLASWDSTKSAEVTDNARRFCTLVADARGSSR
jgi:2-dehydro-3-deoxyphosphogluconate aldolase / (4S)-4-hydroxy-2-oxoglutarate aldolase